MLCLGFLYVVNAAPFLGAVQIIVYTGAIMMLFLFVLMLVGRDASDSLIETLRGQRVAAILLGVGFAGLVGTGLARSLGDTAGGRPGRRPTRTATSRASPALLFTKYVFAFEVTSALLITAAVGAMVLAHVERAKADMADQVTRMKAALPAGQLPGRRRPAPASTPTPCRWPRPAGCRTATAPSAASRRSCRCAS